MNIDIGEGCKSVRIDLVSDISNAVSVVLTDHRCKNICPTKILIRPFEKSQPKEFSNRQGVKITNVALPLIIAMVAEKPVFSAAAVMSSGSSPIGQKNLVRAFSKGVRLIEACFFRASSV
jgi:hypothetical protein